MLADPINRQHHSLTLNLRNFVKFNTLENTDTVTSPARSTGRFQNATAALNNDNQEPDGQQETDPLVPRQSAANQKLKKMQDNAKFLYGSRDSSQGDARLSDRSQQHSSIGLMRAHAGSRNIQAAGFEASSTTHNRQEQVYSAQQSSEYIESRPEVNITHLVQEHFSHREKDDANQLLSIRARQIQQSNQGLLRFGQEEYGGDGGDQDSQTIVEHMTPMPNSAAADEAQYPENKSLSPTNGLVQRKQANQQLLKQVTVGKKQRITSSQLSQKPRKDKYEIEQFMDGVDHQLTFRNRNHGDSEPIQPKKSVTIDQADFKRQEGANQQQKRNTPNRSMKHQFFMDVADVVTVLTDSAKLLIHTSLDSFTQTTEETKANSADLQVQQVVGGDKEAQMMLKFVEEKTQVSASQFLLLNKADYRVYQVEDAALLTSVYFNHAKEQVTKALAKMNDQIAAYITKKLKGWKGTARLGFSSEKELFNIFHLQMFNSEVFGKVGINSSRNDETFLLSRRIMGELWQMIQLFRSVNSVPAKDSLDQSPQKILHKQIQLMFQMYPAKIMTAYMTTKLLLHCRGRALFCSEKRHFPLHKAVFEGNLPLISRLITCKQDGILFVDKNEIDPCGNSALVLAIRLRNIDAVKILTDLYCSAKLNPFPQVLSPLEMAKTMKDRKIVEILMNSMQKVKQHYLEVHKDAIFQVLERLPDFSIDLHFECTSNFIPWMKHLAPTDTYHIYKQGSNLRLDMHFLGYQKLKAIESNISVLFKGRNSGASEGELLIVDHDAGRVTSIFEDATNIKIEKDLDNIMRDEDIQKKYRAEKVKIEPECDRKGNIIMQQIGDFNVQKFQVSSTYTMTKFKLNNRHVEMLTKYKTFEEYLKVMKVDLMTLGNPAAGSTTFQARRDHDTSMYHQNSFALNDQHVMPQISSRPQINHPSQSGTAAQTSLLADMRIDPGSQLQTLGDFGGGDHRAKRNASANVCLGCQNHSNQNDRRVESSREHMKASCSCEKQPNETSSSNFGLTPIITRQTRRSFNASIWLCHDHPLSIETFLPLLQVLSFSSKQIRKLEQAIDRFDLPRDRFPLQAKVPVFMLVEATFCFQELKFGRQPDEVFQIDEQVIQRKRESLKQHFKLLQNQGRGTFTFQSEEDVNRQNQTLTKLYKQLSLPDSHEDESREDSSLSDGIELAYQEMIDNPDETSKELINKSQVNHYNSKQKEEESKDFIIVGTQEQLPSFLKHVQFGKGETSESMRSSTENERLTPANEYDIFIDSASNTQRAKLQQDVREMPSHKVTQPLESENNIKTARQEEVKTMSQINQRHEKHFSSNGSGANGDIQISTVSHFRSQSRPLEETELQYKQKLDVNQQLIERLTGRPLQAQKNNKHTQNLQGEKILRKDVISQNTALERKKRRKEQIRLYKLMKTSKFSAKKKDDRRSNKLVQEGGDQLLSKTMQEVLYLDGAKSEQLSENILDSRVVDERPNVNDTVEKRTLVAYNNPLMLVQAKLNFGMHELTDTDGANYNLTTKNSVGIMQPPITNSKKEITAALLQSGKSTADESNGLSDGNYNSHNSLNNSIQRQAGNPSSISLLKQTLQPQSSNGGSLLSWLSNQANSALKRRYEDQNHLQTIESEEVQGTEGTQQASSAHKLFGANPYHNVNNLASILPHNKKGTISNTSTTSQLSGFNQKSRQLQDQLLVVPALPKFAASSDQEVILALTMRDRSSLKRPAQTNQSLTMTLEERERLQNQNHQSLSHQNPTQVLNRIHQFVVNNKDSIMGDRQNEVRNKKQRGNTSFMSTTSKLQDAGALSPEMLLGPTFSKANADKRRKGPISLTLGGSELQASQRSSQPMRYDNKRSASSLQVLLSQKPSVKSKQPPTAQSRGAHDSYLQQKRQSSDVDIML